MKQEFYEDKFVNNSRGDKVRFDIALIQNDAGRQFAIATERPDTEAPLYTAREQMAQDLNAIEGIDLSRLTYAEKDQSPGMEVMNFKEAPQLGENRFALDGRVMGNVSEKELEGWIGSSQIEQAASPSPSQEPTLSEISGPKIDKEALRLEMRQEL